MKKTLAALGLVVLSACGTHAATSGVASDDSAASEPAKRVAFAMSATLGKVQALKAPKGAAGLSTQIELQYSVPCTEKLESFAYSTRPGSDGKIQLLASAIGSRLETPPQLSCQSIRLETKQVTLPGILGKDSIELVNLSGDQATLAPTTTALQSVGVELVAAHVNCPTGAPCMIGNDNTIVTLRTKEGVSCVEQIAPVTFSVKRNADGNINLAVNALKMVDSRLVACAAFPKEIQLTLPHVSNELGRIELTLVGGN